MKLALIPTWLQEFEREATMNQEPTQEQREEFWEWCGLRFSIFGSLPCCVTTDNLIVGAEFPPIDLNNLFKYAVPNFKYCLLCKPEHKSFKDMWLCEVRNERGDYHAENIDPARALFWALWQVKEVSK